MATNKIIFIHGNGGGTAQDHWLPHIADSIHKSLGITVVNESMPDAEIGPAKLWLPMIDSFSPDENTVIVGFSTGAIATMRYAESHRLAGIILVGAYYTDLGDVAEKQSGYFDQPWDWGAIKGNAQSITVFSDAADPYIPIEEGRYVAEKLAADYHELSYGNHFLVDSFPELQSYLETNLG